MNLKDAHVFVARRLPVIMRAYPDLSSCGFGYYRGRDWTTERAHEYFEKSRVELSQSAELVAKAFHLIQHVPKTKTIRPGWNSYGLKHVIENLHGQYTTNGQFIAAALIAGFTAQPSRMNATFNMSQVALDELKARSDRAYAFRWESRRSPQ